MAGSWIADEEFKSSAVVPRLGREVSELKKKLRS